MKGKTNLKALKVISNLILICAAIFIFSYGKRTYSTGFIYGMTLILVLDFNNKYFDKFILNNKENTK